MNADEFVIASALYDRPRRQHPSQPTASRTTTATPISEHPFTPGGDTSSADCPTTTRRTEPLPAPTSPPSVP
jgi:hypothetical protein